MKFLAKEELKKILMTYLNNKYDLSSLCNELIKKFQDFLINTDEISWKDMLEKESIKFIINIKKGNKVSVELNFEILEFEHKVDNFNGETIITESALIEIKNFSIYQLERG